VLDGYPISVYECRQIRRTIFSALTRKQRNAKCIEALFDQSCSSVCVGLLAIDVSGLAPTKTILITGKGERYDALPASAD